MVQPRYLAKCKLYQQVFDAVPIGLFLIDPDRQIYAWNDWMTRNTSIKPDKAIGQSFKTLYPSESNFRFEWALEQVLDYKNPQILSSILNSFVVPIPLTKKIYRDTENMQQNVYILPITQGKKNMALVMVQDVSDKTSLKNTLLSIAGRFEQHSLIDALTGCFNRRYLWQYLEDEFKEAKKKGFSLVCCMFDIDHFKKINDEFGHDAGDEILVSFVETCRSQFKSDDKFFRYGGEEFIVVFRKASLERGLTIANRVIKALESSRSNGKAHKKITCSGGVAYWDPSEGIKTPAQLIKEADLALYKAKASGRNCIIGPETL